MENPRKYLKKNKINNYNNPFYYDDYFDIISFETMGDGPLDREILGVSQSFDTTNLTYSITFEKKNSIIAYLIICFDFEDTEIKINKNVFHVSYSVDNLLSFLTLCDDKNIITFKDMETGLFDCIYTSIIYTTNYSQTESRSLGEALKKWEK